MTPLAFLEVNPDRVAAIVVNLLAVAGGFLAGMLVFGVLAYFVDRKLTGGKSPGMMHAAARWTGGVIGALLVARLVFGDGFGTGPGDGPGQTEEVGPGSDTGAKDITTPATAKATDPGTPAEPPPEVAAPGETLRVTVLSGADVKQAKFYVVEGDKTPKPLDDIKKELAALAAKAGKPVAVEVVLARRTDPQGAGVQSLIAAAQLAGARVILPGPR